MGERITWEDAVRQDVWQDEKYGGLITTLEQLEGEFGFDPRVVSDIYGERLLDPEEGKRILGRWQQLLLTIQENEGDGLLVSAPPSSKFVGNARYVVLPSITLESFRYEHGDGINPPQVKMTYLDESTKASLAFAKNSSAHVSILQRGLDFQIPVACGDGETIIDITDESIEFTPFSGYRGLLSIADAQSSDEEYNYLRTLAKDTYYSVSGECT